ARALRAARSDDLGRVPRSRSARRPQEPVVRSAPALELPAFGSRRRAAAGRLCAAGLAEGKEAGAEGAGPAACYGRRRTADAGATAAAAVTAWSHRDDRVGTEPRS